MPGFLRAAVSSVALLALFSSPAAAQIVFQAGAAEADITPTDWQTKRYWIAGFGPDRWATSVHDPLLARVLVVDDGATPFAVVALDLIGVCSDDVEVIAAEIAAAVPELEGHLLIHSTHSHEGPDTVGIWGGRGFLPFINPRPFDYILHIAARSAAAVEAAWTGRVPVRVTLANVDNARFADLYTDSRDPQVADPVARLMVFDDLAGMNVATLINWASHPEALGADNTALTGDYVKWVADEVSAALGGQTVFVNGAIGGLLSSGSDSILPEIPGDTFEKAEAIGRAVGERFVEALTDPGPGDLVETFDNLPAVEWRTRRFMVPIENPILLFAQGLSRIPKTVLSGSQIPEEERWRSDLGASYTDFQGTFLTFGPAAVLTMGGELYPELLVGGVEPLGDPPFNGFPAEPPLLVNPAWASATYRFFFGLTNDFVGYVVPVQQWDGWDGGEYGEEFSTTWDEAYILGWNLHLLMAGLETGEYPPGGRPGAPRR